MSLTIPIPQDNFQIIWLLIGMTFGRAFGKKFDHSMQTTEFFIKQGPLAQWFLKSLLDFLHHWWIGALIWHYAHIITKLFFWPSLLLEVTWFGIGIFIDDIRDFRHVLARYKKATNEDEKK